MKQIPITLLFLVMFASNDAAAVAGDTITLRVENFGVRGDGKTDDLPALTQMFDSLTRCRQPARVVFRRKGVYRIGMHVGDLYGRMFLNRLCNVTIEGNGCKLLIHPSSRAFAAYRTRNVIIRNFIIDYSPLPYTQGRVVKADTDKFRLVFKVDKGYPLPVEAGEEWYKGGKMVDCITADGITRKFRQGHSWVKRVRSIAPHTYSVDYALNAQKQLRAGDFFCMKVAYPESRLMRNDTTCNKSQLGEYMYTNTGTITAMCCDNITVSNVTFHASPLMTIVMKGCSYHKIENCKIIGTQGRIVAGCSDGFHLKGNEMQPEIRNCYIERTMDDAIHVKISGDRITQVLSRRRFKTAHMDIAWDNTNLGAGKRVMIFDSETQSQADTCVIATYEPINCREGIVTTDRDIAKLSDKMCVYLMPCNETLIENCNFGTQLQRAILTHQNTVVRNCIIEDNGLGFDLDLMSGGIEGPPTQKLTVENCEFRRLSGAGLSVRCPSTNYWQGKMPQLEIKNCKFHLSAGIPMLRVYNSLGVKLSGNTCYYNGKTPPRNEVICLHNSLLLEDDTAIQTEKK